MASSTNSQLSAYDRNSGTHKVWDLWFPDAGATGISVARSRVDDQAAGNRLLVHAAPPTLEVAVRDEDGKLLAQGRGLERGQPGPMSYLVRQDATILLEDGWPTQDDLGRLVILPGGEAGILKTWWHAEDHSQWRWQVEFYNHLNQAGHDVLRPHHHRGPALSRRRVVHVSDLRPVSCSCCSWDDLWP